MAARGQCEQALARLYTRKEGDSDVKGKPKTRLYVYRPLAAPWLIQKQGPSNERSIAGPTSRPSVHLSPNGPFGACVCLVFPSQASRPLAPSQCGVAQVGNQRQRAMVTSQGGEAGGQILSPTRMPAALKHEEDVPSDFRAQLSRLPKVGLSKQALLCAVKAKR